MKNFVFGLLLLGSLPVLAQVDVLVKESLDLEKTFAGPQQATVTKDTSGDTFSLESIYISANDRNAHLFCISRRFDKAISYRKSGNARTEASEINPDGTSKTAKFDVFNDRDSVLSDVSCIINL